MVKVFTYKMVPAPWIGPGAKIRRVDLGSSLRRMGRRGELNPDGIYWTVGGNSYLMVEGSDFYHADTDQTVDVLSVNGAGETRWKIGICHDGSIDTFGAREETMDILRALGLIDKDDMGEVS